ncbi:T9SS type A sorting domain-containing protein [Ferruginibacter albus]|uniref:T9SS type A sorting domain-containing protein n=1 Tax=Ferruginibacter albus TaxID=2875540 RepID=UPI001CC4D9EF|nr:T9SS type A sorting domain-containing protein [Ferruginibacter albus]UAY50711.1 T9SS type A sorting domain-containing protein [Ferruginibacter albus]
MNRLFTKILVLTILAGSTIRASAQTVFETVSSGYWSDANVWRSWSSGTVGVGSSTYPALNAPVGTNKVIINTGNTILLGDTNRACHGMVIQSGGKLWAGKSTPRRLQIGAGGTGFTYPVNDSLINNGVLGGPGDGLYIETAANSANITLTGTGAYDILRLRTPGGSGATAGGVLNFIIDANLNLYQQSNYALSVVYNAALTDNYTLTINSGKTVTIKDPTGYFHNSEVKNTYGNYTYAIKGTLDLSANTQSSGGISGYIQVPSPAASNILLTVDGGVLKLGNEFKADTTLASGGQSTGILTLQAINGGLIDASQTTKLTIGKTTDGLSGVRDLFFGLDATSNLSQTVGATEVKFPIGLNTAITPNNAYIANTGTQDVFTVGVKNSFDHPLNDPNKVIPRQWNISEATSGGSDATVKLSWLTGDMPGGFNPANPVYTIHYLGSWTETPATITGTGTGADPYISSTSGFTSFSPFGVDNQTGVVPVTFVNIKAYQNNNAVQIDWSNATEQNVRNYVVEKSVDGINYTSVVTLNAKTNNGGFNSYSQQDITPNDGYNFYRIKAVEENGNIKYSTIAKVNLTTKDAGIAIYPNPVKGGVISLQLTAMDKGIYNVNLNTLTGQKLSLGSISHSGGSATQTLHLNNALPTGVYTLEVISSSGVRTALKLINQ